MHAEAPGPLVRGLFLPVRNMIRPLPNGNVVIRGLFLVELDGAEIVDDAVVNCEPGICNHQRVDRLVLQRVVRHGQTAVYMSDT